jgi:DNA processing protein
VSAALPVAPVPAEESPKERSAWLVLVRAPGLHSTPLAALLDQVGSAAGVLAAGPRKWRSAGFGDAAAGWLGAPDRSLLEADADWLGQPGRTLIALTSESYPSLLREIPDPPIALFVRGDPALLRSPQLAIVGSRNPTPSGRETSEAFASALAAAGLTITSGFARGIDAAAHRGALAAAGGRTIAVLGCGPDVVYPPDHAGLMEEIAAAGAVVTELPPGAPPKREHFPQRNRLISGLALGTLVVEASERSGSLITARLATEQGREVFAIPGSIHNALARGCHRLIRQGAKLVETSRDVLEELGPLAGVASSRADAERASQDDPATAALADPEYDGLLHAMGYDPVSIDTLVRRSGLTTEVVSSMLLILELRGDIQAVPGGLYSKRNARNPYGST